MKRTLISLFILIVSLSVEGHEDIIFEIESGQLSFTVGTGFRENEFRKQGHLLKDMCVDYLEHKYNGKEHPKIFIHLFENYYDQKNETMLLFGIDDVELAERGYTKLRSTRGVKGEVEEALIIYIESRVIKAKTILKLLDYGLKNKEEMLATQKDTIIFQYEMLKTIPDEKIQEILNQENKEIEKVFEKKYWRGPKEYYYYLNDQYCFPINNPNCYPNKSDTAAIKLKLDHVFEIIEFNNEGLIVFNTDSTFYFLPRCSDEVQGGYIISNVLKQRIPLSKNYGQVRYVHDTFDDELDRIEMTIEKSPIEDRMNQKVLFFPQHNKIIEDYGAIEQKEMMSILRISQQKKKPIDLKWKLGIGLFILSVLLNLYLIKK